MVQDDVSGDLKNISILKEKMLATFSQYFNELYQGFLEENIGISDFIKNKNHLVKQWDFSRIDIINHGKSSNSLKFINIDEDLDISSPKCFNNDKGERFLIKSQLNKFKFTFRCKGEGKLLIKFRGSNLKHALENKRVPAKIIFNKIKVNDEYILENDQLIWLDNPFTYTRNCCDGEIITIEVEVSKIYNHFPNLMDLCKNIMDDENFISSVDALKNYLENKDNSYDRRFDEIYLKNSYLNQRYVELSMNDNVDDVISSNKNLLDAIKQSKNANIISLFEEFFNMSLYNGSFDYNRFKNLLIYFSSRIDIVNFGEDCNVELIHNSDNSSTVRIPHWIPNKSGIVVESTNCSMDLIVKCIGDGDLKISFRAKDVRDKNKKRFLVYIDYTNISINDESILDDRKLVSHDTPVIYRKKVKDGEFLSIHAEWEPFSQNSVFE
ncbi:hypothetical protein [Methanobrevibacter sp.]|uniref:hypothetical protein n=1 Tax=Methanobrevibacter sp. TaxID=66852 RepID=UPI003890D1A3